MIRVAAATLVSLILASCELRTDASAGRAVFRAQCALCHSAEPGDNGGARGPNLNQAYGHAAAANPAFSYTPALRNSKLTWDTLTLDRFLQSPTTAVPGTAMVTALASPVERGELIAYLRAVRNGELRAQRPALDLRSLLALRWPLLPGSRGARDWPQDVPGRAHRIDLSKLPPPYATASAVNAPRLIARPPGAQLQVPSGFKVNVYTRAVEAPRALRAAPNGDIFLSETQSGRIMVLRPAADGATAAHVEVFAQGLVLPFGLTFYPRGPDPHWLYVAETNRIVRYRYAVGDVSASAVPEIVIPQLSPVAGGGHFTRDLAFSSDGRRLFVSIGSQSNIAEGMPRKTLGEAQAWEAGHGLGAAWGDETNRADVRVFEVGPQGQVDPSGKLFASGLRNCVSLTIQPATDDLWCTTNERDQLGDDLVPDYVTRVREGAFYGWPWYYLGNHEDPRLKGERPDLASKVTVPEVPLQSHSAALSLVFYAASAGRAVFPREYLGEGFAVMHGSWNRASRTGHKVVRIRMRDGVPTGEYDDFLVGWIADDRSAWGRPVGAVVAGDGALLVSDDGANLIYRIAYSP